MSVCTSRQAAAPKHEAKRTIYLPDELVAILAEHVRPHPGRGDDPRAVRRTWQAVARQPRRLPLRAEVSPSSNSCGHRFATGLIAAGAMSSPSSAPWATPPPGRVRGSPWRRPTGRRLAGLAPEPDEVVRRCRARAGAGADSGHPRHLVGHRGLWSGPSRSTVPPCDSVWSERDLGRRWRTARD
jgi:hypothetical protein